MGGRSGWRSRAGAEWLGVYGRGLNVSSAGLKKLRSGAEKRRRLRGREGDGDAKEDAEAKEDVEANAEKEADDARGRVLVIAM